MSLVDRVIAAHGGLELWHATEAIRLLVSSHGPAFALKGQGSALASVTATVATAGQHVTIEGPGWAHELDPAAPRLPRGRWSLEDIATFAATALWTYVSLPFVLPHLDVTEQDGRLVVRFPPEVRTHSPTQVLHIGPDGLIRGHDYTALDFGLWARARQEVGAYRDVAGLHIATRRRIRPRFWPRRPQLVAIDVTDVQVLGRDEARAAPPD